MSAIAYAQLARWARCAVLVSYAVLLLAIAAATLLWPAGERQPSAVIWLLLSVPLLLFLPGLWRGSVNTHAWLCFVSLLYFAAAVINLFLPAWRALDVIELAATTTLFVAATLYIRWRSRAMATTPR
jgi:uncharacterized membrane protein